MSETSHRIGFIKIMIVILFLGLAYLLLVFVAPIVGLHNHSSSTLPIVRDEARLLNAINITDTLINELHQRWEIDNFPLFLKSAYVPHSSWQAMRNRLATKIIRSMIQQSKHSSAYEKFVISFLGSSVTAGHDSPFNNSFPVQVGHMMQSAFRAMDIHLDSRNVGIGNNPCMPYDACPQVFAGTDADVVLWEQSFNCFGFANEHAFNFEQFIRQAVMIPSHPIVVLTASETPNWSAKDCDGKSGPREEKLNEEEAALLKTLAAPEKGVVYLTHNSNSGNLGGQWNQVISIIEKYKLTSAIQVFDHNHYASYKCKGPYVAGWGCCSASWHPSLLGHELRAAHYSYFWLHIYRDALISIAQRSESLEELLKLSESHMIKQQDKKLLPEVIHKLNFTDGMRCFTSFRPIHDPSLDLATLIVASDLSNRNITTKGGPLSFQREVMEKFGSPDSLEKAKQRGYLDYKYCYYGDKKSRPWSIKLQVKSPGKVIVCQPPGVWGRMPSGFQDFWSAGTIFHLTKDVSLNEQSSWRFDSGMAVQLKYHHIADKMPLCVATANDVATGDHILTIEATSTSKIMISFVLIP